MLETSLPTNVDMLLTAYSNVVCVLDIELIKL